MRRTTPLETYSGRMSRRARKSRRRSVPSPVALASIALLAALALGTAGYAMIFGLPDRAGESPAGTSRSVEPTSASFVEQASASTPETAAQAAAIPTEAQPATITIAAVGDMIFDRKVKELIKKEGGQAPLAVVADRLSKADVAIGNLESTIADSGEKNETKDVTFRGHPAGIEGLKLAGFDALSLANNHMLDYGPEPLEDTVAALDEAGIGHAGAGENKNAAWKPATIDVDGTKVAYLAFTHVLPAGFLASDSRAGVASGKMDLSLIDEAVREAKNTHDYVIVSFHWGVEYEDFANGDQVMKARRVIDAGADMVLAHHPHVIQGVEFYNDKLIAYSLGDFVFDHYSRKTGEAFILEAELGPHGTSTATAVPVYLDEYGRPEYVTGSDASVILKRLKQISAPHGTEVLIDGDLARLTP